MIESSERLAMCDTAGPGGVDRRVGASECIRVYNEHAPAFLPVSEMLLGLSFSEENGKTHWRDRDRCCRACTVAGRLSTNCSPPTIDLNTVSREFAKENARSFLM